MRFSQPRLARERAEFYYCLSRAFLTPVDTGTREAFINALSADLNDLAGIVGYDYANALADYRDAMTSIPDNETLLALYSALFLAPPRSIQINTASYIDGALNGGTVAALESVYRACGVERDEEFHDLADHIAVQLEFVAYLYLREAEHAAALPTSGAEFLYQYISRWLPRFIQDLEKETGRRAITSNPYLHLARILATAVEADAIAPTIDEKTLRRDRALGKARNKWKGREVHATDIEAIAQKLRERGLTTDHLVIRPEDRDAAMGLTKKAPPVLRHTARS